MPLVKKCQVEKPANTNQVGDDFRWQPATIDNPVLFVCAQVFYLSLSSDFEFSLWYTGM